jgi:hypothetical protein
LSARAKARYSTPEFLEEQRRRKVEQESRKLTAAAERDALRQKKEREKQEALAKKAAEKAARKAKPRNKYGSREEASQALREAAFANIEEFRKWSHLGPAAMARRVECVSDGNRFPSASAAARFYGTAKSSIIELCNGSPRRKTVRGLVFKYEETE